MCLVLVILTLCVYFGGVLFGFFCLVSGRLVLVFFVFFLKLIASTVKKLEYHQVCCF